MTVDLKASAEVTKSKQVIEAFDVSIPHLEGKVRVCTDTVRFIVSSTHGTVHSIEWKTRLGEKRVLHNHDLKFLAQLLDHLLKKEGYVLEPRPEEQT